MKKNNLQPVYKRQRFLLSFISQLENGATATEIQKLVFLYMQTEKLDFYDFVPYKYGPYSFQLADDIDSLCQSKFLINDKINSNIKSRYRAQETFLFPIAQERGSKLIRKAYREYPYYSVNSIIIGSLFRGKEATFFKNIKEHYIKTSRTLFTIGYEGKSLEQFLNTLIVNDIHVVCDVRKNPLSRKFGFSKAKLQQAVKGIGIKYVHIPNLGIESELRIDLNTENDYKKLFCFYSKQLPSQEEYLEYIYTVLCSEKRIALMCFEKDPLMCHRHIIRDFLVEKYKLRSRDL